MKLDFEIATVHVAVAAVSLVLVYAIAIGGWSYRQYLHPPRLRNWGAHPYHLHGDHDFLEEVRLGSETPRGIATMDAPT